MHIRTTYLCVVPHTPHKVDLGYNGDLVRDLSDRMVASQTSHWSWGVAVDIYSAQVSMVSQRCPEAVTVNNQTEVEAMVRYYD